MSKLAALMLCLVACAASATTNIGQLEPAAGTWRAYRGAGWTTHVCTASSERAVLDCAAADAERRSTTTRYQIRYPNRYATVTFTAPQPPAPSPQPDPPAPPTSGDWLFRDQFEYQIDRAGDADLFKSRGYTHVKAENSRTNARGSGYIYTRQDAALGSRVLVLESRPAPISGFPYPQTDYYLQLGRESSNDVAIPAHVWIQFWTYATPESRFSTRDKTIYPCRGTHPCHPTWLFMWGASGFEGVSAPAGGRYLAMEGEGAIRDTRNTGNGDDRKLFQNVSRTPLLAGRWYQVRLHLDISGEQGEYEAWIKERGQSGFTKVADWKGGVTPNFDWPLPAAQRRPYNIVRIPTTVNQYNNTVYIDDFVIAASEAALP